MALNASQFRATLRRCERDIKEEARTLLRRAATDLKRGVIDKTPVDTGHARDSWEDNRSPRSLDIGDQYRLTNDSGYAIPLEYGTSQQAPNGMVRDTLTEVKARYGGEIEIR